MGAARNRTPPFSFLAELSMAAPTTPAEALEQAALGPKSVTVDGTTVVARDLDELKDIANRNADTATNGFHGLRPVQLLSPGANR